MTTAFRSALHTTLNSQLLLFQHAHPYSPVAKMEPMQALDHALRLDFRMSLQDRFQRVMELLKEVTQGLPKGRVSEGAMIQGGIKVFDEILERFRMAEPVRRDPNDEMAWHEYAD